MARSVEATSIGETDCSQECCSSCATIESTLHFLKHNISLSKQRTIPEVSAQRTSLSFNLQRSNPVCQAITPDRRLLPPDKEPTASQSKEWARFISSNVFLRHRLALTLVTLLCSASCDEHPMHSC